jgi:hypothetical protein
MVRAIIDERGRPPCTVRACRNGDTRLSDRRRPCRGDRHICPATVGVFPRGTETAGGRRALAGALRPRSARWPSDIPVAAARGKGLAGIEAGGGRTVHVLWTRPAVMTSLWLLDTPRGALRARRMSEPLPAPYARQSSLRSDCRPLKRGVFRSATALKPAIRKRVDACNADPKLCVGPRPPTPSPAATGACNVFRSAPLAPETDTALAS